MIVPDPRHALKVVTALLRLEQPGMLEVHLALAVADEDALPRRAITSAMDSDEAWATPDAPPERPQTDFHGLVRARRVISLRRLICWVVASTERVSFMHPPRNPPTTNDVTIVPSPENKEDAEQGDIASEAAPESIPRPAKIVRPDDMKDELPHAVHQT